MVVMLSLSMFTPDKLKSLLDRGGNRTRDLRAFFKNLPVGGGPSTKRDHTIPSVEK